MFTEIISIASLTACIGFNLALLKCFYYLWVGVNAEMVGV